MILMTPAVKWVPLSESMDNGRPQRLMTWFISKRAVVSAVSLGAGKHSTHLVNAQVTVRRYLLPREDLGTGPIQSI